MFLGSHVSMKAPNYFLGSIQEAISYGANACMVYTGPPSNTLRKPVSDLKIEEAHALMKEHGFLKENVIIHAPYIINLANSKKPETAQFGRDFLLQELKRVQAFHARILVLHPGSHVQAGEEIGLEWIIAGLNDVLDQDNTDVCIALETMAGKGSELGYRFEQLAWIKDHVHKKNRIKICLDTCHINDAGYYVHDMDKILQNFDKILGLENLAVIHLNDSKNTRGARKDRHENIGYGTIGFESLAKIVHHPKLINVPMILETPYIDDIPPYKEEIERLRSYQ